MPVHKIAMIIVFLLTCCGADAPDQPTVPGRWYTESQLEAGRPLFAISAWCSDLSISASNRQIYSPLAGSSANTIALPFGR